jgi:hypothetical protein
MVYGRSRNYCHFAVRFLSITTKTQRVQLVFAVFAKIAVKAVKAVGGVGGVGGVGAKHSSDNLWHKQKNILSECFAQAKVRCTYSPFQASEPLPIRNKIAVGVWSPNPCGLFI